MTEQTSDGGVVSSDLPADGQLELDESMIWARVASDLQLEIESYRRKSGGQSSIGVYA